MDTNLETVLKAASKRSQYDESCKRMFSEKIILAWIMKYCIQEYADCDVKDIAEQYIGEPKVGEIGVHPDQTNIIRGMGTEDISVTEGVIFYDIRFSAAAPVSGELIDLIINVEAQNKFNPGYPLIKRGIYYCARMISAQYGMEFTKSNYDGIKKVYSIWICSHPPKNRMNTITQYCMTEKNIVGSVKEDIWNYDLLSVIMVCLGHPDNENGSALLKLLDVLLSRELSLEQKRQVLNTEFDIQMSSKMESEVSVMCNLSQGIFDEGIEKGIEQGIEKGIKQGREKGRIEERLSIIKNMKEKGWEMEQIMEIIGIPSVERPKYIELLK